LSSAAGSALLDSARRIRHLAWPVFIGQVAVLAFSTIDTVLVGRHAALDLAALAIGAAAYITVFIGLMGVVLAVGPIVGQLFGAQQLPEAGAQLHQAVWLALGLSVLGSSLLAFPQPFLWLTQSGPEVAAKVRGYTLALALALPASLLFAAYRGFNIAVSRPKAVMALQLGGLALKLPLTALLVSGAPALGLPALGVVGCGMATCIAMWAQLLLAGLTLRRDPFYAPFALRGRGLHRPDAKALRALLRLGVPMGLSILIEVTGFTFMAFFIARLGTLAVAGHQIAINLVSLMFMLPLSIANAGSTLVAQRIGAADPRDARRLGWHGMLIGVSIAALMGSVVFALREIVVRAYTHDPAVMAAALPLISWLVLFHICDAAQVVAAFVLRAYRIATVPVLIYAGSLWGIGLAGGYVLAFDLLGGTPEALLGARGFWAAATLGLVVAAAALSLFLLRVLKA
jgi:multidrug resistance protein, MATE family